MTPELLTALQRVVDALPKPGYRTVSVSWQNSADEPDSLMTVTVSVSHPDPDD